jgi:AP-3 complex subunit beta
MSSQYLNAITENASRLGMRIQESFSEHTRDFAIARGSALYLDAPDDKNIRRQLESTSDREKLDALKRLVAVCEP